MIDKGEYTIKHIKSYIRYAVLHSKEESNIMSRYATQKFNPSYYTKISLGQSVPKLKVLTREEYQKGVPGLIYMDTRTGRITFLE